VTTLAASSSIYDQPGTLGFLVVFGMAVILTFLFRSMSKHLRKVSTAARREAEAAAAPAPAAASAAANDRSSRAGGAAATGSADGRGD
jgi:Na+-transporting methylmalonyl-CoA/oxaloacetate decarboxylase gamma subunit